MRLGQIPIRSRAEVRSLGAELLSTDPAVRRAARPKSTGGSTGEPLRYFMSPSAQSEQWAQIWRSWNVAGFHPGQPVGIVAGRALHTSEGFRRRIYGHLQNWVHLDAFSMSEERMSGFAQVLRRRRVRFLYGYASALESFAGWLSASSERPHLEAVFTTAEQLLPQARRAIEQATSAVVYDIYGANDGGVFAFECERHDGYHVGVERCVLEIVREDGSPAAVGEVGRVIATDLENHAFPFMRYDVGDLAALETEPCPCGRGLPRLRTLSGRSTDVIALPDHRRVHGEVFSHYFKGDPSIARYQAIQKSERLVEVRILPLGQLAPGDVERIRGALEDLLADSVQVQLVVTTEFEKSSAGKIPLVIPLALRDETD